MGGSAKEAGFQLQGFYQPGAQFAVAGEGRYAGCIMPLNEAAKAGVEQLVALTVEILHEQEEMEWDPSLLTAEGKPKVPELNARFQKANPDVGVSGSIGSLVRDIAWRVHKSRERAHRQ